MRSKSGEFSFPCEEEQILREGVLFLFLFMTMKIATNLKVVKSRYHIVDL